MNDANKIQLKQMVSNDNKAVFTRYFDGSLWYQVSWSPPIIRPVYTFEFPVPISDIGTATFQAKEKALLLMRYIRKHLEMLETAKQDGIDS